MVSLMVGYSPESLSGVPSILLLPCCFSVSVSGVSSGVGISNFSHDVIAKSAQEKRNKIYFFMVLGGVES